MALSEQDRDTIKLIAIEFGTEQMNAVQALIAHHQAECPYGQKLAESKRFIAGVVVGIFLLTTGGGAAGSILVKLLTGP
jgi:hypothetical protein